MSLEKIAPVAIGLVVLVVFFLSQRGAGPSGTRYNVIDVGGDYSDRVAAAGVYRDLSLGLAATDVERLRIETTGQTEREALSVARYLGGLEARTSAQQYAEAQQTRRLEIETSGQAAEAREATQRYAAQAQANSNVFTSFLSFVGTIVGSLVGLSGDVGYYDQLAAGTGERRHAGTQWALVRRGLP